MSRVECLQDTCSESGWYDDSVIVKDDAVILSYLLPVLVYVRVALGMADGVSGKPLWMASTRADMSGSLAVAVRTSSHVTDLMSAVAVDAQVCEQRGGVGSSRGSKCCEGCRGHIIGHAGSLGNAHRVS